LKRPAGAPTGANLSVGGGRLPGGGALRLAPDRANEIETPIGVRGIVRKIAEGNRDLGDPAVGYHARTRRPYRVPSGEVGRIILDQRVFPAAGRADFELVTVTPRHVGVENDAEFIISPANHERVLMLDVEPGPGVNMNPFLLEIRSASGKLLSAKAFQRSVVQAFMLLAYYWTVGH